MRWLYKLPLRLRSLFKRGRVEQELSDELRFHLEKLMEENVARGMTPEEAGYVALRELGGVEQIKEECRDMRRVNYIENFLQERPLRPSPVVPSPGFAAVALLTLALGIGANAAIFSVMNAVLLRPLPFPDSDQLVLLWDSYGSKGNRAAVSYPNFLDWRAWSHSFSGMAALTGSGYVLTGQGDPVRIEGMTASASLFQVWTCSQSWDEGFCRKRISPTPTTAQTPSSSATRPGKKSFKAIPR